ncbi:hypothetical protein T484DRAFT_1767744, partial [Baffinella frigidus]
HATHLRIGAEFLEFIFFECAGYGGTDEYGPWGATANCSGCPDAFLSTSVAGEGGWAPAGASTCDHCACNASGHPHVNLTAASGFWVSDGNCTEDAATGEGSCDCSLLDGAVVTPLGPWNASGNCSACECDASGAATGPAGCACGCERLSCACACAQECTCGCEQAPCGVSNATTPWDDATHTNFISANATGGGSCAVRMHCSAGLTVVAPTGRAAFGSEEILMAVGDAVRALIQLPKTVDGDVSYTFMYEQWNTLTTIAASGAPAGPTGPAVGNFTVVVHGQGFNLFAESWGGYTCIFYRSAESVNTTGASVVAVDVLHCPAPAWGTAFAEGAVNLRIFAGSDSVFFTNGTYAPTVCAPAETHCSIAFYAYITSASPSVVGACGGSVVTVSGAGFDALAPVAVRLTSGNVSAGGFSADGSPQSATSPTALQTLSPVWTYTGSASMTFLGATGLAVASAVDLVVAVVDGWSDKNVSFGPAKGGSKIGVVAAGPFLASSTLECFFSVNRSNATSGVIVLQNASSPLTVESDILATCLSPFWDFPSGTVGFSLRNTTGGSTVGYVPFFGNASVDAILTFRFMGAWDRMRPPTNVSAAGGTTIHVDAFGLSSSAAYLCEFRRGLESITVAALAETSFLLSCVTPAWGDTYAGSPDRVELILLEDGAALPFVDGGTAAVECGFRDVCSLLLYTESLSVTPASGTSGASIQITGAGFNDTVAYECKFSKGTGSALAPETVVAGCDAPTCLSFTVPAWTFGAGAVALQLLTEDGDAVAGMLAFTVEDGLQSVAPTAGPARDATPLAVAGYGFAEGSVEYTCAFCAGGVGGECVGGTRTTAAAVATSNQLVECNSTVWPFAAAVTTLKIFKGSVAVFGTTTFEFLEGWDSLAPPASGRFDWRSSGGEAAIVRGFGFQGDAANQTAANYSCLFSVGPSGIATAATVANSSLLTCRTPEWGAQFPTQLATLAVLRDSVPVAYFAGLPAATACGGEAGCALFFFDQVHSITPDSGAADGGYDLALAGHGLDTAEQYRCNFSAAGNYAVSAAVTPASTTALTCVAPVWEHDSGVVSVTLRQASTGRVVSATSPLTFTIRSSWSAKDIYQAPARGGTTLNLVVAGLDADRTYECFLAAGSLNASSTLSRAAGTAASCVLPAWPHPAASAAFSVRVRDGAPIEYAGLPPAANAGILEVQEGWDQVTQATLGASTEVVEVVGFGFAVVDNYTCVFTRAAVFMGAAESLTSQAAASNTSSLTCSNVFWGSSYVGHGARVELTVERNAAAIAYFGGADVPGSCSGATACSIAFVRDVTGLDPISGGAAGGEPITIRGAGFDAALAYSFAFSDAGVPPVTVTTAQSVSLTEIVFLSPTWNAAVGDVLLQVLEPTSPPSFTGPVLVDGGALTFTFLGNWVGKDSPSGPARGDFDLDVTTTGFEAGSSDYQCKFSNANGDALLAPGVALDDLVTIRCVVPEWDYALGTVALSFYKGATEMSFSGSNPVAAQEFVFFQGYDRVVTTGVSAVARTPADGSGVLSINGYGFDNATEYTCRFTHIDSFTISTTANASSRTLLRCPSPAWGLAHAGGDVGGLASLDLFEGGTRLAFTNFGRVDLSTAPCRAFATAGNCSLVFATTFFSALIATRSISAAGETLTIQGFAFDTAQSYQVSLAYFDHSSSFSTTSSCEAVLNSSHMVCTTAPWAFRQVYNASIVLQSGLGVSIDNSVPPVKFKVHQAFTSFSPTTASARGGAPLSVHGYGFDPALPYACIFPESPTQQPVAAQAVPTAAAVVSAVVLTCASPVWDALARDAASSLLADSVLVPHATHRHALQNFTFFPEWVKHTPPYADRLGGVNGGRSPAVTVTGFGFNPARQYKCVWSLPDGSFTVSSEAVEAVSRRATVCVPPVWDDKSASGDFASAVLANLAVVEYSVDGASLATIFSQNGSSAPGSVPSRFVHINRIPTFLGSSVYAREGAAITIANWATDISAGVNADGTIQALEANQSLTFLVTDLRGSGALEKFFSSRPVIHPNGTLQFTARYRSGLAAMGVILQDDGGPAYGGFDASSERVFSIYISPAAHAPEVLDLALKVITVYENADRVVLPRFITDVSDGSLDDMLQEMTFQVGFAAGYFVDVPYVSRDGALVFAVLPFAFGNTTLSITSFVVDPVSKLNASSAPTLFRLNILPVNTPPHFNFSLAMADGVVLDEVACQGDVECPVVIGSFLSDIHPGATITDGPQGELWDESDQSLNFTVTVVSGNLALVRAASVSEDGELTLALLAHAVGSALLRVTLSDNTHTPTSDFSREILLEMSPVNDPPFFAVECNASAHVECACDASLPISCLSNDCFGGPAPCSVDVTVSQNCQGCSQPNPACHHSGLLLPGFLSTIRASKTAADDERNQTLSFAVTYLSGSQSVLDSSSAITVSADGTLSLCLVPDLPGLVTFNVALSDSGGATSGDDTYGPLVLNLIVEFVNQHPRFSVCDGAPVGCGRVGACCPGRLAVWK